MESDIRDLWDRLQRTAIPDLGKSVGDFMLYDALMAGLAERASRGKVVALSEIPVPDDASSERVAALRNSSGLTQDEQAFVEYFDLLECIREELNRLGS